jgi:cobalt-zinc-cadmium efflux system protein
VEVALVTRERTIQLTAFLNLGFALFELLGGLWTNSLAIVSDALHDVGDGLVLLVAWLFERGAARAPDAKRTFGYQRLSLFSAVLSAAIIVGGSVYVLAAAVGHLFQPTPVNAVGMMGIAVVGIVANGVSYLRLKRGLSVNARVLSWHLLEDLLGWVVLLVASVLIQMSNVHRVDAVLTIGFTVFVVYNVAKNVREAFNILLQGVPDHIDLAAVRRAVTSIAGVTAVHDVHVWSLEGETDVFTGHVVVDDPLLDHPDRTRRAIKARLAQHHIEHSTIELESERYCSGIECACYAAAPARTGRAGE